jgi:4'-phosphopantetheinyl transferase EntD
LGITGYPILRGPGGEPLWPTGVVGSITHCDGYCAAAVAWSSEASCLGIDAEPNVALGPSVLKLLARKEEREMMGEFPDIGINWDCLLFCAKEAVFKAYFPTTNEWLGFEDALLTIDPENRAFLARVNDDGDTFAFANYEGRFQFDERHVVAAVSSIDLRTNLGNNVGS